MKLFVLSVQMINGIENATQSSVDGRLRYCTTLYCTRGVSAGPLYPCLRDFGFDVFWEKYGMADKLQLSSEESGPRLFETFMHDQSYFPPYLVSRTGTAVWPGGTLNPPTTEAQRHPSPNIIPGNWELK